MSGSQANMQPLNPNLTPAARTGQGPAHKVT